MLDIRNLHVRYGAIEALQGVSLHVKRGEIVALLGANGAGKSTTLLSIMRIPPPDGPVIAGGEIAFDGVEDIATTTVWVASTSTFNAQDLFTLPGGETPLLLSCETFRDEFGITHSVLGFGP